MLINLLLVFHRTLAYFSRFFERIFKREQKIENQQAQKQQLMSKPKALPVNDDVAYSNYSLFNKRSNLARQSVQKAVEADETSLTILFK